MRTLLSVFLASIFLTSTNAFAQADQFPPTATIVNEGFGSPPNPPWQQVSGRWAVSNGTYGDNFGGATDISTETDYRTLHPSIPPIPELRFEEFFMRARVLNLGSDDTHHVGIVYGYQDSQNYYEVLVSAVGHLRVRTVMNGIAVDDQPDFGGTACTRNIWCELEVRWKNGVATVKVNGQSFFQPLSQPEFTHGQVGLVTHSAVGRFDKVFVGVPLGDQAFLETFDGQPSVTFTPQSGQWSVVNGSYRNSAIQQTAVTLSPIRTGIHADTLDTVEFTFRARMLNPYANSGNLVGIVFNYQGSSYSEAVFSPTGVAQLRRVDDGVATTLATANYGGSRNVAFEVTLENEPNFVSVLVNGRRIFANVPAANPEQFPEGGVGLITHWAPGRFDNVQFDHGVFQPCAGTFSVPLSGFPVVSGTWDTNGGTLNSTAVGQSDVVDLGCGGNFVGDDAGTNEIYSARLRNEFGASGNLVGLLYNYSVGDYFEIVFSTTGIVQLNKFIQGVRYPVRSRTHNIPRNTWFDVQVIRTGIFTTIKLNGTTILENEPQGELRGGSIGAITHWTKGHFDDVSLRSRVSRPPSQL